MARTVGAFLTVVAHVPLLIIAVTAYPSMTVIAVVVAHRAIRPIAVVFVLRCRGCPLRLLLLIAVDVVVREHAVPIVLDSE